MLENCQLNVAVGVMDKHIRPGLIVYNNNSCFQNDAKAHYKFNKKKYLI